MARPKGWERRGAVPSERPLSSRASILASAARRDRLTRKAQLGGEAKWIGRTLTIGAQHDEMDPDDMRRMAALMPNARAAICPHGSHFWMWDDQANYFNALVTFLKCL